MSDVKKSSDGLGTPLFVIGLILSTYENTPKWLLMLIGVALLAEVGYNIYISTKTSSKDKQVQS
jgi:hypothetical protein